MARQQDPAPGGMLFGRGFDWRLWLCVGSHSHILAAEWRRRSCRRCSRSDNPTGGNDRRRYGGQTRRGLGKQLSVLRFGAADANFHRLLA
jgi:hypothetical protein